MQRGAMGTGTRAFCNFLWIAIMGCGGAREAAAPTAGTSAAATASTPLVATHVAVGGGHACALTREGDVLCWGSNARGELAVHGAVEIALGDAHSCARMQDGTVQCWGAGEHGELGDGKAAARSQPSAVPDLTDVIALAAGGAQTCAVKKDGVVVCWGARGDVVAKTPIPIFGLSQATAIAVGPRHACAVVAPDSSVRCWGDNALRQLGVPRLADRGLPSEVKELTQVKALLAGRDATCALTDKGALECWGGGLRCVPGAYQEGRVVAVKPAPIEGLEGLAAIATGGDAACGIQGDGSVACVHAKGSGEGPEHACVRDAAGAWGHVASLALGDEMSCAIDRATNEVRCARGNAAPTRVTR